MSEVNVTHEELVEDHLRDHDERLAAVEARARAARICIVLLAVGSLIGLLAARIDEKRIRRLEEIERMRRLAEAAEDDDAPPSGVPATGLN